MDFVQGILVEHKLETYNMPRTGTTSRHPKKWLCRSEHNCALDTVAPISLLVHINGDDAYSPPKIPDTQKYTVTLNTIPHTSSSTLPSQHPAKPFRLQH